MEFDFDKHKTQGVKVNYYYICHRKLWLFSKGISFEKNDDRVLQGKVLHEYSYNREKNKEIEIDNTIKVDIMDKENVKEIKISSKMKDSDRMQLLYYLYYLKQLGINRKGKINYTKEKRVEEISLTTEDENTIENVLVDIKKIENMNAPPKTIKKPYCKKCAYYEFCYSGEEE
ncbi:CRISPR-associated protein Cas4 [Clostridium paridis]|uniref:CRISPR-associated exonuclease Cas4 n=1 Tax=Clostridium paridis TaxID=2803863 RepID=A0A937FH19_9CLOT|nr:CRISPR-associated protein Cas4 [Clostridium paridis]MBL4931893.1 CRISPR-associated protein Cas4 [Clostridium paridis]